MNRLRFDSLSWLAIGCLLCAAPLTAAETKPPTTDQAEPPRFETHIAPIFKAHCYKCHGADSQKAELNLSTPQGVLKGGESGAAVEPGKLGESLLWDMVHEGAMPPEDEDDLLTQDELELIRRWIEAGAPFDKGAAPSLADVAQVDNHVIEPLMQLRCAACHGLRNQEGGLDLRTKTSMLKGGKSGPAIVLGKPEESLLLQKIHAGEMPPRDRLIRAGVKPMAGDEIEKLTAWIKQDAPNPVRHGI